MNSKPNWVLEIDPAVYKFLKKMPHQDAEHLLLVIENLLSNPFTGDIQKMKGETNTWRRRIGSYWIFYEIVVSEKIIHVFKAKRRTSKTYD